MFLKFVSAAENLSLINKVTCLVLSFLVLSFYFSVSSWISLYVHVFQYVTNTGLLYEYTVAIGCLTELLCQVALYIGRNAS